MATAPARPKTIPAPVGGWDTRSAIAEMPEKNAVIMDNWFPGTDRVTLRRGSDDHVTGMSGNVETLFEYAPLTGSGALFAANGGNIYDVTSAGTVGAAVATGKTNARWQQLQIGTAGGQFLFAVNGADAPINYNGSAWATTPAITGPTATNLAWCNLHQRRLWIGEKDSLQAWYLPVNSIGGAATAFSLAGVAKLGGYIMAMGTWTRDAGDGPDDVAVFITSEGEAIIYQGIDPSTAASWALTGVFRIGKPIGRRCIIKGGGDLIIITQDGFVNAASILVTDRAEAERVALSSQINKAVNDAVRSYGGLFGWQPIIYPLGTMLMVNVPQSATVAHQYVFNTLTGAPCRFKGMNALCWGLLNDGLYFGTSDGRVVQADTGTSDNGTAIEGDCLQAFSDFGSPNIKRCNLVEPVFDSVGNPNAALDLNVDYQIKAPTGVSTPSPSSSARWGISKWGIGTWGTLTQIYKGWRGVRGIGKALSLRVRVSTTSARPAWITTNFSFTAGGIL